MANSLQKQTKEALYRRPKVQRIAIEGVREGHTIAKLARGLEKGDPARRRRWHKTLVQTMMLPEVMAEVHGTAMAYVMQDLIPTVAAVGRRGRTGRMDAARWLGEASGFHNPRVRHEHSGEVQISINMPRPERTETVIDAAVVEDD